MIIYRWSNINTGDFTFNVLREQKAEQQKQEECQTIVGPVNHTFTTEKMSLQQILRKGSNDVLISSFDISAQNYDVTLEGVNFSTSGYIYKF